MDIELTPLGVVALIEAVVLVVLLVLYFRHRALYFRHRAQLDKYRLASELNKQAYSDLSEKLELLKGRIKELDAREDGIDLNLQDTEELDTKLKAIDLAESLDDFVFTVNSRTSDK